MRLLLGFAFLSFSTIIFTQGTLGARWSLHESIDPTTETLTIILVIVNSRAPAVILDSRSSETRTSSSFRPPNAMDLTEMLITSILDDLMPTSRLKSLVTLLDLDALIDDDITYSSKCQASCGEKRSAAVSPNICEGSPTILTKGIGTPAYVEVHNAEVCMPY